MPDRTELNRIVIDRGETVALRNRERLDAAGVLALNLIGSPGSGKTTLLETTINALHAADPPLRVGVVEGDVQTAIDRDRILAAGAPATQIQTEGACHLDPVSVGVALEQIPLDGLDVVVIENVGNLICPVGIELGEHIKVAVVSIPEGDEKPAKYPAVFTRADAVVFSKVDLLPYLDYDLDRATSDCRKLNPTIRAFPLSAKTGEGLDAWADYLAGLAAACAASAM
jgi:hydrogenase nickel incorporation protein HypB